MRSWRAGCSPGSSSYESTPRGRPEPVSGFFGLILEAQRGADRDAAAIVSELRAETPVYVAEVVRARGRGVERVERVEAPPQLVAEHAALVAAQREYVEAVRRLGEAFAGESVAAVAAAADEAQRARTAIDTAFARLGGAA